jgi:hypothetical protein
MDFYEVSTTRELVSERFDDRQLPDAGSSPIGVEVDEYDALGARYLGERALRF